MIFTFPACDPNCLKCDSNGAGKCDKDMCKPGFTYIAADMSCKGEPRWRHSDVIMSAMASQITGVSIAYSTVCSGAVQRKHQSSASLAFVRGIHWWPVNSSHKGPATRKMIPLMTSSWRIQQSFQSYCIPLHDDRESDHNNVTIKFTVKQWHHWIRYIGLMASIVSTSADILSTGILGTNRGDMWIEMPQFFIL